MIYIHPQTQKVLDAVFAGDSHALLLSGPVGIGLSTIASDYALRMAEQLIPVLPEKEGKIDIEKGTITVESIRRLYDITRMREPKGRVIIVDYAERMAPAAQNAFLKLLEEPSKGTRFILLTHQPEIMLPTILSRSQKVELRPITVDQSLELLGKVSVTDATKRAQLMFIAEGLPAELSRLATDEKAFEARVSLVKDARTLVTGNSYERLLIAKKYKDSRSNALLLLQDAMKLLRLTIAAKGDAPSLRLLTRFEVIHKRITEQGNVRLQLSATVVL